MRGLLDEEGRKRRAQAQAQLGAQDPVQRAGGWTRVRGGDNSMSVRASPRQSRVQQRLGTGMTRMYNIAMTKRRRRTERGNTLFPLVLLPVCPGSESGCRDEV